MGHLDETQTLDAVDGRLDAAAAAHIASCERCRERVAELHSVLQTLAAADEDDVPEPSPLFWQQFPARVSRAIDAEPQPVGWLAASRWWWGSAATVAVVLMLVVLPLRRDARAPSPVGGDIDAVPLTTELETSTPENLEDDEAWAMVRAVAEETEYEQVEESGLTPRPGSLERAALELSDGERAELARLIEQDARDMKSKMKRTGASTP